MKTYLFDSDDFVLISYLKSEMPKKIWWTPIEYIFEYPRIDKQVQLKVI